MSEHGGLSLTFYEGKYSRDAASEHLLQILCVAANLLSADNFDVVPVQEMQVLSHFFRLL